MPATFWVLATISVLAIAAVLRLVIRATWASLTRAGDDEVRAAFAEARDE
ncbi:hypothetical protein GCM10009555_017120 [Acrocarpospora macrocephala]|uniref:Uncharacterized protein n=1 Tax=Acrocarpospora macrocephala TaxID=150177 RepID=A0A5M3WGX1_9ACTN|nr:hypothetical protein [Acrocarpospora macrocephala]GES07372.1 hypothetical protein Amac_009670 [Acrocarpospora macrocephala]